MLLAKIWDKINAGMQRNIPANTAFLSPRELEMARYLFGEPEGLTAFGGYEGAERKMLVYLPEYLDADYLFSEDSPMVCLRAGFYEGDTPSHRAFLGALMGAGIARETVGDICVGKGSCDFFVTAEIAPYILHPGSCHSGTGGKGAAGYPGFPAAGQRHLCRFPHRPQSGCPICQRRKSRH